MVTKTPKVSIITPSYNHAPFLEQCIRSVLAQDYPNIECIVIDGGSTDGSVEIIRKYEDKLAYWESAPDEGQSHAINKGFQKAGGDIVAWLNSDDLYFPGAVSTAVKSFRENPDLTLFYGNCVYVDEDGSFVRYFTEVEPYDQNRLLNYSDYIMQPTTFFSREKLVEVGYLDESLHFGMDWDLWCKLSRTGTVHYEERLIAANRDYAGTKTNSGGLARLKELWKLQCRHKTGFWHHGFWGYLAAEINHRSARQKNRALGWFGRKAAVAVCHLSPSAVMFSMSGKKNRHLYGFIPYSRIAPLGKAEIHLPIVDATSVLEMTFETEPGTRICINGAPFDGDAYRVRGRQEPVSLVFEFTGENGSYRYGNIKELKLSKVNDR